MNTNSGLLYQTLVRALCGVASLLVISSIQAGNLSMSAQRDSGNIHQSAPGGKHHTLSSGLKIPTGPGFNSSGHPFVANRDNRAITDYFSKGTKNAPANKRIHHQDGKRSPSVFRKIFKGAAKVIRVTGVADTELPIGHRYSAPLTTAFRAVEVADEVSDVADAQSKIRKFCSSFAIRVCGAFGVGIALLYVCRRKMQNKS